MFYNKSGFNKNLFNKLLTKSNLTSFEDTPLKNLSTIFNGIVIKREDDFTSFDDYKNLIIVFHCEFSKNRAPKM